MEKIDGSQFVRRTKQWTPTVYRVGRTGESPILRTKKTRQTRCLARFFMQKEKACVRNGVVSDTYSHFDKP